ncbi:leukocyte receptor cluster member 1 [Macrosteles quadrilineatus]|uniref:leukocyte receptor cluster member 1 n=1 Tax=Macrosteles quadrilineatus TaxID=74068 RepID=UPI0023E2ED27|nr:leukocyte receptor cluster member 1 [Macrosteles quadrilineatus]
MNILPKKRWHVRTKENIARVRRDEAKAAEEEKAREQRAKLAEQEARTNLLRAKARAVYDGRDTKPETSQSSETSSKGGHINFFQEIEDGLIAFTGTNKEYENEKKEEKEKYEKQIGYLTYLGQDTVEATGNISWWNKTPDRLLPEAEKKKLVDKEMHVKSKQLIDPLNSFRRYLGMSSGPKKEIAQKEVTLKNKYTSPLKTEIQSSNKLKRKREDEDSESKRNKHKRKKSKKHKRSKSKEKAHRKKKHNKHSSDHESDSSNNEELPQQPKSNLEELRAKRIQREQQEKLRAERVLAKLRGESLPEDKPPEPVIQQKYSSQFNPHLAKQNFEQERTYRR